MSDPEKQPNPPAEEKKDKKEEEKKDDKKGMVPEIPVPAMPNFGGDSDGSYVSAENEPIYGDCCCCHCVCANSRTQDLKCFGCFPIKCGIIAIGIFTLCLAAW